MSRTVTVSVANACRFHRGLRSEPVDREIIIRICVPGPGLARQRALARIRVSLPRDLGDSIQFRPQPVESRIDELSHVAVLELQFAELRTRHAFAGRRRRS